MKNLFIILLTALTINAGAQDIDFDNYRPIRSKGSLPADVVKSASEKFNDSKKTISKKDKAVTRKDKEEFLLSASFSIDEILLSGNVLYNDPIAAYCQKVLDEVLKDETGSYVEKIKLYVLRSDAVNAYSTTQGYIFITTGLIAQLSTEAELAFVLCHEVIHFKNKHAIKAYVENKRIVRGEGAYRTRTVDDKIATIISHSKENETESDEEGFDIFKKSKYSFDAIQGTFDVLMYSYLPFDDVEYDTNFLGNEHTRFPRNYFLESVEDIAADEDYDDEESTHPNIASRREAVDLLIEKEDAEGRVDFIVSESEFLKIRKICRFEVARLSMMDQAYVKSFYEAYCLLKEDPNSVYLKKIVMKSLYGLTAYADKKKYKSVTPKWEKLQGNVQQCAHFFSKLSATEINVLAVEYAWKLRAQHPEDKEIRIVSDELMRYLVKYHFDSRKFFSDSAAREPIVYEGAEAKRVKTEKKEDKKKEKKKKKKKDEDDEDDDNKDDDDEDADKPKTKKTTKTAKKKDTTKSDKYKKITSKKKNRKDYLKYAFVDLLQDTGFRKTFDRYIKLKKEELKSADEESDEEEEERKSSGEKLYKRHGYALGVDKILIVNPLYYKINEVGDNTGVQLLESEAAQGKLTSQIKECSDKLGLKYEMVDSKHMSTSDADKLNDLGTMDLWLAERIDNFGFLSISTEFYDIQEIIEKYNTKYLCVMGVFGVKDGRDADVLMNGLCCAFGLPGFVHFLSNSYLNTHTTYMFINVYDMETGKKEMVRLYELPFFDRNANVSAMIYDAFYQIKSDGKGVHLADNEEEASMLNSKDLKKKEKNEKKKKGDDETED